MEILNDNCKNVGFQLHCCNLQAKQKFPICRTWKKCIFLDHQFLSTLFFRSVWQALQTRT